MAVQIARPISDQVSTGWTAVPASPATLFDKIDEVVPDDADYASSAPAPDGSEPLEVLLSAVSDPLTSDNHKVRYRLRKDQSGGAQVNFLVELVEGTGPGTVIASWNHVDVSNSWTTFGQDLTTGEADSITDYGDLRLRFTPTQV